MANHYNASKMGQVPGENSTLHRRDVFRWMAALGLTSASVARAQVRSRVVGVIMGGREGDPAIPGFIAKLREGLSLQGWDDPNPTLIVRMTAADRDRAANFADELISLQPDVIVSNTTPNTAEVLARTDTIPVVFLPVADPVTLGFVESYARPGGNATGFTNFEPSHTGVWLELLTEIAPTIRRAILLFNPDAAPLRGRYYGPSFEEAAAQLGLVPALVPLESVNDVPAVFAEIVRVSNSGIVVNPDIFMWGARTAVVSAADQYRLPAVYPFVNYTDDGGLMSYSVDTLDLFRRAGDYVGRILNGASPAELPVQAPAVFRLVINLRTAAAHGLQVPVSMLAAANELIE